MDKCINANEELYFERNLKTGYERNESIHFCKEIAVIFVSLFVYMKRLDERWKMSQIIFIFNTNISINYIESNPGILWHNENLEPGDLVIFRWAKSVEIQGKLKNVIINATAIKM